MKMKKIFANIMAVAMLLSICSCFNGNSSSVDAVRSHSSKDSNDAMMINSLAGADSFSDYEYIDYGEAVEYEYDDALSYEGDTSSNPSISSQMLIKRKYMTIETIDFNKTIEAINNAVRANNGYVESSNMSGTAENQDRFATYCFRVPASQYESCSNLLNQNETIVSMNESTEDVTSDYIDIEAHLVALRTEYDTLIGLLEQAEDLDTILILQNELSNVRFEIEWYEGSKRVYDDLVSYSTITVSVYEIVEEEALEEVEEEAEPTFKERISKAFEDMKEDTQNEFESMVINMVENLPYVIAKLVIFIAILIAIIVVLVKTKRKKKNKNSSSGIKENINKNEVCDSESNKSTGDSRGENNGENK